MAKRKADSGIWWKIGVSLGTFTALVGGYLAYAYLNRAEPTEIAAEGVCLPETVSSLLASANPATKAPAQVNLYFDVSGGMAGYVSEAPNAIGDLATLAGNYTTSSLYSPGHEGSIDYYRFGEYRFDRSKPTAPQQLDDPRSVARPGIYTDQDTNIADLLDWIAHTNTAAGATERPLSLIVTDLMLDDREAVDRFEASVGGRLRRMVIDEGLSVGVMGVRVPFSGPIFAGGNRMPAAMRDRPLIILMIGDPAQVRSFYDYLDSSERPPFSANVALSDRAFSLFGLKSSTIAVVEPQLSGLQTGFTPSTLREAVPGAQDIPAFAFDPDKAADDQDGGLVVRLEADAGVQPFEVVGNEPLWEAAVWKLDPGALDAQSCANQLSWLRVGSLPLRGWQAAGQNLTYTLDAATMAEAGMTPDGTYLVQYVAGQRGIVPDHPATAWMSEWSMSNERLVAALARSPAASRTGVPGLGPLRNILLTELRMPGREEIERTASHMIIQN